MVVLKVFDICQKLLRLARSSQGYWWIIRVKGKGFGLSNTNELWTKFFVISTLVEHVQTDSAFVHLHCRLEDEH